jgi:DNA-binding XRE family transcriptional regulator
MNRTIGDKIKKIRELKKVEVNELAERCNLSQNQIIEIENGKQSPSLGPLIKIARGLGVRLGTFTDDQENLGPVINKGPVISKALSFTNKEAGSHMHLDFYSLARDKAGRHMEPYLVDISPSDNKDHILSSHEGEEFIYVIQGKVEITYGNETYILEQGDSIYYDSIIKHNVHSADENRAQILGIVYVPF